MPKKSDEIIEFVGGERAVAVIHLNFHTDFSIISHSILVYKLKWYDLSEQTMR